MNVTAIIQARLTSTRLPGKVLLPIGPCEALWHTIARTRLAVPNTVVAIPDTPENDRLAVWLTDKDVPYWRGPEQDVLLRYQQAAARAQADVIVRITGDCPFVDPEMVAAIVSMSTAEGRARFYASNVAPRLHPRGLDVEVFSREALDYAALHALLPHDREHVTPFLRKVGTRVHQRQIGAGDAARYRWTLDTIEDYAWFCRLADRFDCTPPHPTYGELLAVMEQRPELAHYEPADR